MNIASYFYNHNLQDSRRKDGSGRQRSRRCPIGWLKPSSLITNAALPARSCRILGSRKPVSEIGTTIARCSISQDEYGGYLQPRDVIHWMIDTVSKNGTFILNIPGKPDGTIDSKEIAVLDGITAWMQINGEAIYETRPWKLYGEGPDMVKSGSFQGTSISKLGAKDIRFTRNKTNTVILRDCPRLASRGVRNPVAGDGERHPTRKNRTRAIARHRRKVEVETVSRRIASGITEAVPSHQRSRCGAESFSRIISESILFDSG